MSWASKYANYVVGLFTQFVLLSPKFIMNKAVSAKNDVKSSVEIYKSIFGNLLHYKYMNGKSNYKLKLL